MINKPLFKQTLAALACIGALLSAPAGRAAVVFYHFDVNTAPLVGNPAGPFSLDFQLIDGSGAGDANNTATIGNLTFGGGGISGPATTTGGAAGDLGSGITLTDSQFFNELYQGFTPGTSLGFDVTLTVNGDAGLTPDGFSFAILDSNLFNLPTTGVGDTLALVSIYASGPVIQTGATTSPPGVTVSVPEPSVTGLVSAVGLLLAGVRARKVVRRG
jgi:hypothetical protein